MRIPTGPDQARRCIVYVRISRDREGAGLGVARQEQDGRELADRLGWEVVAVEVDNDISAASGKLRPGYERMLTAFSQGKADAVIAWHPDRLHRRPDELERFITVVERHGIKVQTCTAGDLDLSSSSGLMVARMLGAAARYEVDHARERMMRKRAELAAKGQYRGGRRPFGYEADGMTVREVEAHALALAAEALLGGSSLSSQARAMREAGITTTSGVHMDSTALRRILLRPRNAGLMEVKGQVTGAALWPAIVPEATWRAVVALLRDPSRKTNHAGGSPRHLLSGLARCGVCFTPVIATRSNGRMGYACPTKHVVRGEAEVDHVVTEAIESRLRVRDVDELVQDDHHEEATAIRTELEAVRLKLSELSRLFMDGVLTSDQLREGTEAARKRSAVLQERLDAITQDQALSGLTGPQGPRFSTLDLDRQRSVVSALADVVLLPAPRGRPKGWQPGQSYFTPESVQVTFTGLPGKVWRASGSVPRLSSRQEAVLSSVLDSE